MTVGTSMGAVADRSFLRTLDFQQLWREGMRRMLRAEDRLGVLGGPEVLADPAFSRVLRELHRRESLSPGTN